MSKSFYESVKHSTQESHVQEAYNNAFKSFFNIPVVERKHQCDGYFETKTSDNKEISVLIEYKYDIHMKDRVQRSKVIAQCLGYLKQFEQSGEKLPKLVFIGDINECCIIHTNDLLKLLDLENVDWSVAPSSMGDKNIDLVFNIAKDISPWVYDVNDSFTFKDVADKITDLCNNVSRKLHITEKNIEKVYNLFCDRVIKDKKKVQANDLVSTFIGTMLDPEHYYQHPRKKNILVANDKQVAINGDQFELFMQMHSTEYSPKEKRIMTAISDRLIEDTNRRNKGEFYTPTLFVDYAHSMIENELGVHWKENYVVWDPAAGTLNLTRDYRFKELYCSTLEQAELDISKNYNKEATKFQFDFLNDSLDDLKVKAPGLLEAFELNKHIVFFLNPPYAGTNSGENKSGAKGLCATNMNNEMKKHNIGACSQNLYAQFIYRLIAIKEKYNLTNCHIGLFSPTLFLTGQSWNKFRNYLFNNFYLCDAIQFNAGHFSNVASSWGISFSFWNNGTQFNKNEFEYKIVDNIDGAIKIIQNKILYNLDNSLPLIDYSRNKIKNEKCVEQPNLRTGITWSEYTVNGIDGLGYFYNKCNNVGTSGMHCSIWSSAYNGGHGYGISIGNFNEVCLTYSVRKLIENTWINSKDEYLIPNESHPKFQEFVNNSIVYSLFSNQSSLRQIKYHDKLWDIKNEFFWMSKSEIESLANEFSNDTCYSDVHTSEDRFVYKKLQEINLTPEAQAVLDKACDIVRKTFKYRELFNEEHPEYQINNWDCGFYQIKALLKEFMPDDLKEFRTMYKQLADKMRPMVYELGFLKK